MCLKASQRTRLPSADFFIALNLSALRLRHDNFCQRLAAEPATQIVSENACEPATDALTSRAADMRRENHIVHGPERMARWQWFGRRNVETRTGDLAVPQRLDQSRFVDQLPARNVDEIGG